MKFVLLVEGDTEKSSVAGFLQRWLDPQLTRRVGVQVVKFAGYGDFERKIVTKAQMYLDRNRQQDVIAVVGLLDLYGPTFYPQHLETAAERYAWGVEHFEQQINDDRFRMFFAVHEFEAWLLSQPEIFPQKVKAALAGKVERPENVNFHEPPAKLLNRLYNQYLKRSYKKTTYGRDLFGKLDPSIAAQKCPYLKRMLNELLVLAQGAGL